MTCGVWESFGSGESCGVLLLLLFAGDVLGVGAVDVDVIDVDVYGDNVDCVGCFVRCIAKM